MKKILITGATGFVGSHLSELCVKKGYDVIAFDRYNPNYMLKYPINIIQDKLIVKYILVFFEWSELINFRTLFLISSKFINC